MPNLFDLKENNPETQATIDALSNAFTPEEGTGNTFGKGIRGLGQSPSLDDILGSAQPKPDLSFITGLLNKSSDMSTPIPSPVQPGLEANMMQGVPSVPSMGSNLPPPMHTLDQASATQQPTMEPTAPPADMGDTEMKQALADRKQNLGMLAMLSGANIAGNAIAGVRTDPNYTSDLEALAKLPVEDIKALRLSEKEKIALDEQKAMNNAGSQMSAIARKTTKDMLVKIGYKDLASKIGDNMSAQQIHTLMGGLNIQNLMTQYESMQNRLEVARTRQHEREEMFKGRMDEKDMKSLQTAGKLATAAINRNNTAFGRNANVLRAANAMEALTGQIDYNNITPQQVVELAKNLDSMLTAGSATVSGVKDLLPRSAIGDANKIAGYIMNKPKGAGQGKFVKQIMETVTREKAVAQEQISQTQKQLFAPYMTTIRKHKEDFRQIADIEGLDPSVTAALLGEVPGAANGAPNLNTPEAQQKAEEELKRRLGQ